MLKANCQADGLIFFFLKPTNDLSCLFMFVVAATGLDCRAPCLYCLLSGWSRKICSASTKKGEKKMANTGVRWVYNLASSGFLKQKAPNHLAMWVEVK